MLNDPELDKMIIYGLAGVCLVLLIAVIFLAVKRNVYYVDEDGVEVPSPKAVRKVRKVRKPKAEPAAEPEPEPEPEPVRVSEPAVIEPEVIEEIPEPVPAAVQFNEEEPVIVPADEPEEEDDDVDVMTFTSSNSLPFMFKPGVKKPNGYKTHSAFLFSQKGRLGYERRCTYL